MTAALAGRDTENADGASEFASGNGLRFTGFPHQDFHEFLLPLLQNVSGTQQDAFPLVRHGQRPFRKSGLGGSQSPLHILRTGTMDLT